MIKSFLCFELLWAFEGLANNRHSQIHYYGLAIGPCFFGVVTAMDRKN